MTNLPAVLAVTALLLAGCPAGDSGAPTPDGPAAGDTTPLPGARPHHRGVSWVAIPREVTAEDFGPLVAIGADRIVQTPFGWQERVDSPSVRLEPDVGRVMWGETDVGLEVTTRLAQAQGIRTLLKPHVWIRHREAGEWRADIAMAGEEDWRAWFDSYTELVLHYARLAERLEIPALAVGTELHATVRERPDDWRRVIRAVREVYSGELTYAANWYDELEDVTFWDELDFIGVQAYFPLSDEPMPTADELVAGWAPHVGRLEALSRKTGKPILFTEMGYVSREGAATDPWTWPEQGPEHLSTEAGEELQVRAYEAFFRALWDRPWFAGVYVWKWFPGSDGEARNPYVGYTPQGKPAQEVLRRWFGGGAAHGESGDDAREPTTDGRGYTAGMKTAISLPDPLFEEAEALARRLGKSRSQLYVDALSDYVARHDAAEVTRRLDRVLEALGEPGSASRVERAVTAASAEALRGVEW